MVLRPHSITVIEALSNIDDYRKLYASFGSDYKPSGVGYRGEWQ